MSEYRHLISKATLSVGDFLDFHGANIGPGRNYENCLGLLVPSRQVDLTAWV